MQYCISGISGYKSLPQLKLLFEYAGDLSKEELLIYKLCVCDTWEELEPYVYSNECYTKKFFSGITLLMIAVVWDKSTDILQKLIDRGSNVNSIDDTGRTALHYNYHNYDNVKFLLEHGANINLLDEDGDSGILDCFSFLDEKEKFLSLILKHNPTLQTLEKIWSCYITYGYLNIKKDDIVIFKMLLDAGVNPNIYINNETLLHVISKYTIRRDIMQLLIDYGADVNAQDEELGGTPLIHISYENRNLQNIKLLIRNGADPYIKDRCNEDFFGHYDWSVRCKGEEDYIKEIRKRVKEIKAYTSRHKDKISEVARKPKSEFKVISKVPDLIPF